MYLFLFNQYHGRPNNYFLSCDRSEVVVYNDFVFFADISMPMIRFSVWTNPPVHVRDA